MSVSLNRIRIRLEIVIVLSILLVALSILPLPALAASASASITPSSSEIEINSNKTYTVTINSGSDQADTVQISLSYDVSKLAFVSMNIDSSNFPIATPDNGHSNGIITFSGGTLSPHTGSTQVGTFTLKAIDDSGSSSLTITTAEAFYQGNPLTLSGSSATVNLTSTPAPPTTTPLPTNVDNDPTDPSGNSNPDQSDSDSASQSTRNVDIPPKISNEEVTNIGFNISTLNVSSNENVRATLELGLDDSYGIRLSSSAMKKEHRFELNNVYLLAGTQYQYRFTITDSDGNKVTSDVNTFKTKGYSLELTILDKDGAPLKDAPVTLFSNPQSGTTNNQGVVLFADVSPGQHTVKIELEDGQTFEKGIQVSDSLQSFAKVIDASAQAEIQLFSIESDLDPASNIVVVRMVTIIFAVIVSMMLLRIGGHRLRVMYANRPIIKGSSIDVSQEITNQTPMTNYNPGPTTYQPGQTVQPGQSVKSEDTIPDPVAQENKPPNQV